MNSNSMTYHAYVQILKEELLPAMGCTEPIAIAYCAAKARDVLGEIPDSIEVEASGNIIKNVKSVVVPNTEGRKGLEAAAAIGVLGGDADKGYEVIASVRPETKMKLGAYLETTPIKVLPADSDHVLDVSVLVRKGEHHALVRAVNEHTNIVRIEKDAQILLDRHPSESREDERRALLNIHDIYDFAKTARLDDVRDVLSQPYRVKKEKTPASPYRFEGKNVLLVEDNLLNQEIAQAILQDAGFTVDTADDGDVAVERLQDSKQGEFDLVLMDIQMPKMDGDGTDAGNVQVTQHSRAKAAHRCHQAGDRAAADGAPDGFHDAHCCQRSHADIECRPDPAAFVFAFGIAACGIRHFLHGEECIIFRIRQSHHCSTSRMIRYEGRLFFHYRGSGNFCQETKLFRPDAKVPHSDGFRIVRGAFHQKFTSSGLLVLFAAS